MQAEENIVIKHIINLGRHSIISRVLDDRQIEFRPLSEVKTTTHAIIIIFDFTFN